MPVRKEDELKFLRKADERVIEHKIESWLDKLLGKRKIKA